MKKIDAEIVEEKIRTKIKIDEKNSDLISVKQTALENSLPEAATLKILLTDYPDDYIVAESYLISKKKINSIADKLDKVSQFVEACNILSSQKIPDPCHADLLSKMGYEVTWEDLDPNNATISKNRA